jgi:hypothetical protein
VPNDNWICACPYLPLDEPVRFAGWWLGALAQYEGPWKTAEPETEARRFLAGFQAVDSSRIEDPALLVREAVGVDGNRPTNDEIDALRLAIGFATIDANPIWTAENSVHGWAIADNADLWIQPGERPCTNSVGQRSSRISADSSERHDRAMTARTL